MRLCKELYMVNKDKCSKIDCTFQRRPIPVIFLFILSAMRSVNDNLLSRFNQKVFLD